jgi:hypothetical protein
MAQDRRASLFRSIPSFPRFPARTPEDGALWAGKAEEFPEKPPTAFAKYSYTYNKV